MGRTEQGEQSPADESVGVGEAECKRARYLRVGWRVLVGGVSLVSTLFTALAEWSVGPLAQKGLGAVALALFLFHAGNVRTRIRLGHWGVDGLRPQLYVELVIGLAIPLGIALAAGLLPPTWETLLAICVAFAVAHSAYEPLEEKINVKITAARLRQGTNGYGEAKPLRIIKVDDSVNEIARRKHGPGLQRFLAFWLKPPWRPLLSRTRTVILYVMLTCSCVAAGASIEVSRQPQTVIAHIVISPSVRPSPATLQAAASPVRDDANAVESYSQSDAWRDTCPFPPAYGAPSWARAHLNALYVGGMDLNADPPPSTAGGCTRKAVVHDTPAGPFVHTVGWSFQGEVVSTAVDSPKFGPALFLAPAAQRAIALIEKGHIPLGGYPKMYPANGDAYMIRTPEGTVALVRAETHLPGQPDVATPYVELSPTVASAWADAMNEVEAWLWPQPPVKKSSGHLEFLLTWDSFGLEPAFTLSYDPRNGAASRDHYIYELPEPQLSQGELEDLAELAR